MIQKKKKREEIPVSAERLETLQETQLATLNILEDFNTEKIRLEDTQRAVLNILDDFAAEKEHLEGTQKATLNILDDFNTEKTRLEDTQRAVLNILDDLNSSNEELKRAHGVLEARVTERTTELQRSYKLLQDEIEERRRAEELVKASLTEKEALLREIHHRVKNNLQIIYSMLNLQLPQVRDEQSIGLFKESQNRVYTMALIHEKLYKSESMARIDLPEYMRSLVANLFLSYGMTGKAIKPKINVENVSLDVDTAIPCALIVNELVSNSLKHAFPGYRSDDRGGEICVSLRRDADSRFTLTVSDNGSGFPEDFEIQRSDSLGLKLVSALAKQLRGTVRVSRDSGTALVISFPAKGEEGF
ncbi:MAG: histidine kinase [Chloroflexi bacterium]|nr:histidine kinase [Chloroflexota bacterium]